MKSLIISLVCMACILACKKGIQEDKLYVRRRLFLLDTITQYSKGVPLPGKGVVIAHDNADSLDYINSDTTDANGYFTFTILSDEKNDSLIVRFEDTIQGRYYKGSTHVKVGMDNAVVIATLDPGKQNGFILRLVDDSGAPLPTANVQLYANQTLASNIDSTGAGAIMTFQTDAYGVAYKFDLPAGNYYVNAEKNVGNASYQRLLKSVPLLSYGFFSDTMMVKKTINNNGFILIITDTAGGAIPKATVNLYTSQVLSMIDDPTGAIASLVSDNNGKVTQYNIDSGSYYVSATKATDSATFQLLGQKITVPASGLVTDTIKIKKK